MVVKGNYKESTENNKEYDNFIVNDIYIKHATYNLDCHKCFPFVCPDFVFFVLATEHLRSLRQNMRHAFLNLLIIFYRIISNIIELIQCNMER